MSHENAPATKLIATHCAACGKPLLDAESVLLGVGPVCVKRYLPKEVDAERAQANSIIYLIASLQRSDWQRVRDALVKLAALPRYGKLAKRIEDRLKPKPSLTIKQECAELCLYSGYHEGALADLRKIPGRRFVRTVDAKGKEVCYNAVPLSQKRALWSMLQTHFAGEALETPGGDVVIVPSPEPAKQLALGV
jgi:hypothetical protein